VVAEAPLVQTEAGLAPAAEGWFILNARDACWFWDGRSACPEFEGEYELQQVGVACSAVSTSRSQSLAR
jgi:hypothetical protein